MPHDAHVHKVLPRNIKTMDAEFVGYSNIARQNRELAEWHRNSDYSIMHPQNGKIPWSVPGHVPGGLRVLKTQEYEVQGEISVTCAAKYLSFANKADFLSYVDIVVPDIVGPAIDIMHYHGRQEKEKINAYSDTPFGLLPSAQNQDLIDHTQNQNIHRIKLRSELSPYRHEPMRLLEFFCENTAVREWLATLATLLTEPKLILTNIPVPPGCIVEREEYLWRPLFILTDAVQIMVFAPVDWCEDGSYKSTAPYARRFPLGFLDQARMMKRRLGTTVLTISIELSFFSTSSFVRELRRCSKVQSTWEDSILALKLSSRLMYRFAIAEQNVEGVVDQRVVFRMNMDIDTLRVFDMGLPDFLTANGPSVLPVRKLLSISKISFHRRATDRDTMWHCDNPLGKALDLEKLPKLEEFSLIFPKVAGYWMIGGLPRVRTQTEVPGSAHTGIKWQFNTGLYPVPGWKGRSHNSHFNGPEKPYMHPDTPILEEAMPYVGHWGYEHSPGAIGGYWASFQYFEKTNDVYFAPLSWMEVELLVKGPFRKNGREALYEDHTPRFVAKLRIVRQGTTPPTGWIKVEQERPGDPKWKHQLLNTWKSVWYTLTGRRSLDYLDELFKPCPYYLRQT
ncbi:uncharacterized protein LW93_14236 [Fusarium fujikuroi]|nr:uncharacterized protein LW93_14236 [Fusarium fujikuroi]